MKGNITKMKGSYCVIYTMNTCSGLALEQGQCDIRESQGSEGISVQGSILYIHVTHTHIHVGNGIPSMLMISGSIIYLAPNILPITIYFCCVDSRTFPFKEDMAGKPLAKLVHETRQMLFLCQLCFTPPT